MDLSVVMPAWNEIEYIESSLEGLSRALADVKGASAEIIVVDDGSTDGTRESAKRWIEEHRHINARLIETEHVGKGNALRVGTAAASGDHIAWTDSDGECDFDAIPRMYGALLARPDASCAVANVDTSRRGNPALRKIYYAVLEKLWGQKLPCLLSGCRMFHKSRTPDISSKGFMVELEVTRQHAMMGPILWIDSELHQRAHGGKKLDGPVMIKFCRDAAAFMARELARAPRKIIKKKQNKINQ